MGFCEQDWRRNKTMILQEFIFSPKIHMYISGGSTNSQITQNFSKTKAILFYVSEQVLLCLLPKQTNKQTNKRCFVKLMVRKILFLWIGENLSFYFYFSCLEREIVLHASMGTVKNMAENTELILSLPFFYFFL